MTSKEFTRRCEFFAVFEDAAQCFNFYPYLPFIYKFSVYSGNRSSESYSISLASLNDFLDSFPFIVDLLYVERYNRSQFNSQYKYFLSFLSRLSERQMSSLVSSGRFEYLLKFKDEMSK